MLNVSVPTRLPFMKMPKLPESATLELPFSFSLSLSAFLSAALRHGDAARTALRKMASFSAFTFLFRLFDFQARRLQQLFNLHRDLLYRFIQRLHREPGLHVIRAPGGKQLVEAFVLLRQRTHLAFSLAPAAQFINRSFQKHGEGARGAKRVTVLLLHKRSAAKS